MKAETARALLREYRQTLAGLELVQIQGAPEAEVDYERRRVANIEARILSLLIMVNEPQAMRKTG